MVARNDGLQEASRGSKDSLKQIISSVSPSGETRVQALQSLVQADRSRTVADKCGLLSIILLRFLKAIAPYLEFIGSKQLRHHRGGRKRK